MVYESSFLTSDDDAASTILRYLMLILLALSVAGCASGRVELKDEARISLQLIEVSKEVKVPYSINLYLSRISRHSIDRHRTVLVGASPVGLAGGLLLSVIGNAIEESANQSDEHGALLLQERMECEIPQILREKFIYEISRSNLFKKIKDDNDSDKADAVFVLSVGAYGFWLPGHERVRRPYLCVSGSLIENPPFEATWQLTRTHAQQKWVWQMTIKEAEHHRVIWQYDYCEQGMLTELPSYSIAEYVADSSKFREAFEKAAGGVVKDFIYDMKGISPYDAR